MDKNEKIEELGIKMLESVKGEDLTFILEALNKLTNNLSYYLDDSPAIHSLYQIERIYKSDIAKKFREYYKTNFNL